MDEPDAALANDTPQFRTYASDVAKLTGKPPAKNVVNVPAPADVPVPKTAPTPKPEPEAVAPAPEAALSPKPYDPPPAEVIPKAPTTDESRETVLARLRAKAAPAGPIGPVLAPAKIVPKAPSTDEKREEVLARLRGNSPAAPVVPVPPPVQRVPEPPPGLPPINRLEKVAAPAPLHTYKSDFSDKAKETGASKISILAAEQNALGSARPVPQLRVKKKSRALFIGGAVLLIIAGGASIYAAYALVTGHPAVIVAPQISSLIFADAHAELSGTGADLRAGLVGLDSAILGEGGVEVAYITYATTTAKGDTIKLPATGGALISALGLGAPDLLLRNVDPASTAGVIRASGETRPFFIFRVASFERTFAGMLAWEPDMGDDLAVFYPPYPEAPITGTTTATSTAASTAPAAKAFGPSFADEVVDNHDVRVLRDSAGRSILLYGYQDKQTLVIARNEAAFTELLARLASTKAQ